MDQQPSTTNTDQPPVEQVAPVTPVKGKNKRLTLALWLMIGPTALIIGSLILYAIVNFLLASTMPTPMEGEVSSPHSPIQTILNVILFLVGVVSVVTWLPGMIAGIILLATQKKS